MRTETRGQQTAQTTHAQKYEAFLSGNEHVSLGEWIRLFLINLIPCVGPLIYMIVLFVLAFSGKTKKSLKTFAGAQLIFIAVASVTLLPLSLIWLMYF